MSSARYFARVFRVFLYECVFADDSTISVSPKRASRLAFLVMSEKSELLVTPTRTTGPSPLYSSHWLAFKNGMLQDGDSSSRCSIGGGSQTAAWFV